MEQMDFMSTKKKKIIAHQNGKNGNDLLEILGIKAKKEKDYFSERPLARLHEFYLSGTIESADEYVEWFDTIRHASETDVVKIYINSYGGDLFTAIQFMRAIGETDATVAISVEGACMSAATMIFLMADAFEVSKHSMFMFHNYSGGTFGKGGEMLDQLQHERTWSEKLLRDIYSDFLTDKEIESMLNNKDIWMDGDEVVKRLKAKAKKVKRNSKEKEGEQEDG